MTPLLVLDIDTFLLLQVAVLFPINALRNAGLLLAATPLVMMMDLDMLISPELSAIARDRDRYIHGQCHCEVSPAAHDDVDATARRTLALAP